MATFTAGDCVDWAEGVDERLIARVGVGPFTVRGVERAEPEDDHCQWVALRKDVGLQLFCWADYQGEHGEWIPDHDGPPYIAAPPTFSNTWFRSVEG